MDLHPTTATIRRLSFRCTPETHAQVSLALDEAQRSPSLRFEPIFAEKAQTRNWKAAMARRLLALDLVTRIWDEGYQPSYEEVLAAHGERADWRLFTILQDAFASLEERPREALRAAAMTVQVASASEQVEDEARYLVRLFDSQVELERELARG